MLLVIDKAISISRAFKLYCPNDFKLLIEGNLKSTWQSSWDTVPAANSGNSISITAGPY